MTFERELRALQRDARRLGRTMLAALPHLLADADEEIAAAQRRGDDETVQAVRQERDKWLDTAALVRRTLDEPVDGIELIEKRR